MDALVSIIIPAYNAEKYIIGCLESCSTQTYKNTEVIVIDDGSSDNTYKLVKEYSENADNVVLIHTENKGVSNARNLGIEASKGDYITFIDADDELFPEAVYDMLKCICEKDADIVKGGNVSVTPGSKKTLPKGTGTIKIWKDFDMLEGVISDNNAIYAVWAKLYKKSFISDIRFKVGQAIHEDSYFLYKCALKKPKMVILDSPVYRRCVTGESVSAQSFNEKKYRDIMDAAEEKFETIKKLYPQYEEKASNIILKASMAAIFNFVKTYDKTFKGYEKECVNNIKRYKKHFVSASRANDKLFFAITHNMYFAYKLLYHLKNR